MPGMFRGRSRGGSTSSHRGNKGGSHGGANGPLKGRFEKGIWKCDCTPREPAVHFQVKKESANKGRWFFTCQKPEQQRCGFFLWDEDAKPRMEAAVLSNSTSEPVPPLQQPARASRSRVSPRPPYNTTTRAATNNSKTTSKRKLPWLEAHETRDAGPSLRHGGIASGEDSIETDSDANEWGISSEEEQTLRRLADRPAPPVTPRKAQKTSAFATPSRATGLPTPDTTPSKPVAHAPQSPLATKSVSLLASTLELLESHKIKAPTALVEELDALYTLHERQAQGVVQGRQVARLAVKARDRQILELTQRVSILGSQVECGKTMVRYLREKSAAVKGK